MKQKQILPSNTTTCMSSSNQSLHSGHQNTKYSPQCESAPFLVTVANYTGFMLVPFVIFLHRLDQICFLAMNWIQNQKCFDSKMGNMLGGTAPSYEGVLQTTY